MKSKNYADPKGLHKSLTHTQNKLTIHRTMIYRSYFSRVRIFGSKGRERGERFARIYISEHACVINSVYADEINKSYTYQHALSRKHFRFAAMYSSTITEYEDNKGRKSTGTENGRCSVLNQPSKEHIPAVQPLIWRNIIGIASLHVVAIYMFATRYHEAKFWTWMWGTHLLTAN